MKFFQLVCVCKLNMSLLETEANTSQSLVSSFFIRVERTLLNITGHIVKLHPLIQSGFEQVFIEGLVCVRQYSSCLGFSSNKTKISALLEFTF